MQVKGKLFVWFFMEVISQEKRDAFIWEEGYRDVPGANYLCVLFPSQYTEDVALRIEHIQINLSKIILLDEIGKENLLNFSSSGIEGINFGAYLTEVRPL